MSSFKSPVRHCTLIINTTLEGSIHTPVVQHDLLTDYLHNYFTKSVFV